MAFDFPLDPVVGQRYPNPSVEGLPSFVWDGEKWIITTSDSEVTAPLTPWQVDTNGDAIVKFGDTIVLRIKPTGLVLIKDDVEVYSVSV